MNNKHTELFVGNNLTINGEKVYKNGRLFYNPGFDLNLKRFSVIVLYARGFSIRNCKNIMDFFTAPAIGELVFVVGENREKEMLKSEMQICWGKVTVNTNPYDVIYSSLKIGLRAISRNTDYIILHFGTSAKLHKKTIIKLIEKTQQIDREIIIPVYNGKRGHPIIFSQVLLPLLFSLRKEKGLPYILKHYKKMIAEVPVDDESVIQKR